VTHEVLLSRDDWACRESYIADRKGIRWMQLSHAHRAVSARFNDPNLVSCTGLGTVAARCGLGGLVTEGSGSRRRVA
jgi:hypothetical protein